MRKLVIVIAMLPMLVSAQIYKEHDKQAHFFAGMVVAYHIALDKTGSKKKATVFAIAAPILVGSIKECIDLANPKKNKFDCRDLAATSFGAVIVIPINIKSKRR